MTCQHRRDDGSTCGSLARWVVTSAKGRRTLLCTIHKLTAVSRDPDLRVELA